MDLLKTIKKAELNEFDELKISFNNRYEISCWVENVRAQKIAFVSNLLSDIDDFSQKIIFKD